MDITNVIEIADDLDFTINEIHAQEILKLADALKEGAEVEIEDVQEAIEDFERQCEDDKTIMRERERSASKRRNFDIEENW